MAKQYDLVVVGAGTSGLEAAKTAAQNGLQVALVEMKTHPAKVQRACAQMFLVNMDHFYNERMYFSREQKKWIFPVNNFSVNYAGPYREFYGCHFISPDGANRIEFGDYEKNRSGQGIAAVVFDKGALLAGLFEECQQAGVHFFPERTVVNVQKNGAAVAIATHCGEKIAGTFCIAADGINSLVARKLGMNRERLFFASASAISYYITGVSFDRSEIICMGNAYDHEGSLGMVHLSMLPSVYRDDEYWLYTHNPEKFEFITKKSVFSPWFKKVEVTHKRCCVINMWSPAREPFKDNVLFIGDTVWFAEAENNGALLSGHKAANAVCKALHIGQPNRDGVMDYISWWKQNWYETHDYRDFLCYPVFFNLFNEQEMIYLHKIIDTKLFWSINPFNLYATITKALTPHMEQIKKEQPVLAKKLAEFSRETAIRLMRPVSRHGFPPYA
jgi:flavin-dependent dehydrogenase